jgi:calcineurin-like phosphoesterase family protein
MSTVYVTSDWHFGHTGITQYFRRQFPTLEAMEDHIFYMAMGTVTKRDVVFMIGDMAFDQRGLDKIKELPCRKILIRGNHDTLPMASYMEAFDDVQGALRYKGAFITHIPIHPTELYRGYNVHGHCHRGGPAESQSGDEWWAYYNAIVEFNDYQVVPWSHVAATLKQRREQYGNK